MVVCYNGRYKKHQPTTINIFQYQHQHESGNQRFRTHRVNNAVVSAAGPVKFRARPKDVKVALTLSYYRQTPVIVLVLNRT